MEGEKERGSEGEREGGRDGRGEGGIWSAVKDICHPIFSALLFPPPLTHTYTPQGHINLGMHADTSFLHCSPLCPATDTHGRPQLEQWTILRQDVPTHGHAARKVSLLGAMSSRTRYSLQIPKQGRCMIK